MKVIPIQEWLEKNEPSNTPFVIYRMADIDPGLIPTDKEKYLQEKCDVLCNSALSCARHYKAKKVKTVKPMYNDHLFSFDYCDHTFFIAAHQDGESFLLKTAIEVTT